jgi:hypothetical protein
MSRVAGGAVRYPYTKRFAAGAMALLVVGGGMPGAPVPPVEVSGVVTGCGA